MRYATALILSVLATPALAQNYPSPTLKALTITNNASVGGALTAGTLTTSGNAAIGGTLTLPADPTLALQAATKQYVDAKSVSATFTGGTVPNATTFQGTGTGLTVSNNASVGGTLSVTGGISVPSQGNIIVSSPNGSILKVGDNAGGSAIADGLQILGNAAASGRVSISTINGSLSDINITPGTGKKVLIGLGTGTLGTGYVILGTNATYSGSAIPTLNENLTIGGTVTGGGNAYQNLLALNDGTNITGLTGGVFYDLFVPMTLTANSFGTKSAVGGTLTVNIKTASSSGSGAQYIGGQFTARGQANDNGDVTAQRGTVFGSNSVASLNSSATYWYGLVGSEIDILAAGTGLFYRLGQQIVNVTNDVVQGSLDDQGLSFNGQSAIGSGNVGWKILIGIGRGGGRYPLNASSTIMAAVPYTGGGDSLVANYGIKLDNITFGTAAYTSPGFSVDGSGSVTGTAFKVGATAGVSCSGAPTASFASTNGIVIHC
jgi:fibronectin-binding autotransporter adhesin